MRRYLSEFWSEERNLSVLLGFVVFDFFVLPLLPSVIDGKLLINFLNNLIFSFLLLFGVIALTRHKIVQAVFAVIVALIILVRWNRLIFGGTLLTEWDIFLSLVSTIAFVVVILIHVYKEGEITTHRIQGAITAYLLIAMAFALTFFLIEFLNPGSFQFPNPVTPLNSQSWNIFYYFSICNLTTLGYGDITPLHPFARNFAMMEAITGQLYPVIFLARLVSLNTEAQVPKKHR